MSGRRCDLFRLHVDLFCRATAEQLEPNGNERSLENACPAVVFLFKLPVEGFDFLVLVVVSTLVGNKSVLDLKKVRSLWVFVLERELLIDFCLNKLT